MDFKQLEVFVCVAKHKSFSKAARELFLTQPTVSSHIQNLEKELDTVLINRNNKTLSLTESGKILYTHSISILNNCKKAVYDIKEYSGKIEGIIDIASSSIPETYILPMFLKSFSNDYPYVKFNISHYDSQLAISEILNEKVSFGFVGSKICNPQIQYVEIKNDELILITPKSINLDNINGYINKDELYNLDLIMRKEGSGTRKIVLDSLSKNKVNINNLNIISHVESNESIKQFVRLGFGCSFVSSMSISDLKLSDEINIYRIDDVDITRKFYFIYSKKKILTPLENKLLDFVKSYFIKNEL